MIGFKSDFEIFETVDLVSGDIKYGTINLNKNTQEFEFVFINGISFIRNKINDISGKFNSVKK